MWMLAAAIVLAAVEALGLRGWDNFFIVVVAVLLLRQRVELGGEGVALLPVQVAGAALFVLVTVRLKLLDLSGGLATGLMGLTFWLVGQMLWLAPAFAFFFTASGWSRYRKARKQQQAAITEKGATRDAGQVYANGGVAWACAIGHLLFPSPLWWLGCVGAFAAANADTWGTELGGLSRRLPRLITTGAAVPAGTSGGVSLLGLFGGMGGALVVGGAAWLVAADSNLGLVGIALAGGLAGTLMDSLAGATVQAKYEDAKTGKRTERSGTESMPNELIAGLRWINNDAVNALCTLTGAVIAITVWAFALS